MSENILGIIGGSGFETNIEKKMQEASYKEIDTPFGEPSSKILTGRLNGAKVAFLNRHGAGHKYSPTAVPYRANIFALKKLGVKSLIATAAVGSLRENIHPKELVLVDQFIDKTTRRESSFFNETAAVHCDFAKPTCGRLNEFIKKQTKKIDINVHERGTYVCMEGPQFSTKAESVMHRSWGGDLIGMTAMPEAKLAREAQICYSMIALVTDYDCWKEQKETNKEQLISEIISNLTQASENTMELLSEIFRNIDGLVDNNCMCRKCLAMANMTDTKVIDENKWKQLQPLFE